MELMATTPRFTPAELDALMNRGWPGLIAVDVDGWLARLSGGITQRANSVLPITTPRDIAGAIERTEGLYRDQGINPTFQISPAARPAELNRVLADRGYELRSPTLVLAAGVHAVLRRLPKPTGRASVDTVSDEEWLQLWWSVDGRGDDATLETAARILAGCPAFYAAVRDDAGIVAVGRLALADRFRPSGSRWGGLYCMAVRADARRQGHARAILAVLAQAAAAARLDALWLQVVESNGPAQALYRSAGFTDASRYHYRVLTRSAD